MLRPPRGLMLQDFARDGEDLLDTLLASARRPADLQAPGLAWHAPALSSGQAGSGASSLGSSAEASTLSQHDISALHHYKSRVGPELRQMRRAQGANREYYTLDHLRRLKQFEAQVPFTDGKCSDYCKDYHVQPCKACTTCHFCRQKTIDPKTFCPCYYSTKRIVGGKGRGFWCGSCLYIRMGENLHEAKNMKDWRCPCCRDICNCSGANCLRARRNLAVTNQLIHEATKQGFKSVAHYLILTHLSEQTSTMPMLDITNMRKRDRPEVLAMDNPVFKQARLAYDVSQDARHRSGAQFQQTAAQHIRKQLQLLAAELPLPPESDAALAHMAAAGFGSHVLEDDQCEDDEDLSTSQDNRTCIVASSDSATASGYRADHCNAEQPHRSRTSGPHQSTDRHQNPADPAQQVEDPFFVCQDGTALPRNSFAACAWGMASQASRGPKQGEVQNSRQASPSDNAASAGRSNAPGPESQADKDAHAQDSIRIDNTAGPWDGPHPGLAASGLSSSGQARCRPPLSLVHLPTSLLPKPRSSHSRSSLRNTAASGTSRQEQSTTARQAANSTSAAAAGFGETAGETQHAQASSSIQSSTAPVPAASHASVQGVPQHSPSPTAVSGRPVAQQGQQGSTGQDPANESVLSSQQQSLTGADSAAPRGSTPSLQAQPHSDLGSTAPSGQLNASTAAGPSHGHAIGAGDVNSHVSLLRAQTYPEGQLADLPDRPGHLATEEDCRVANGGVCWHLLQLAIKARNIARKQFLMQEGYSQLLQGLLDKMTQGHSESVGIVDAAFAALMSTNNSNSNQASSASSIQHGHIRTHADLKYAAAILLLAAEALAETDVQFSVCRLLFNQEPFVDFIRSDLRARAMLIKASFDMLTILQRRGFQVQGVCKGIMQMLGNLAGEYEKLLARVAVRQEPLALGQELQVGPYCMPAATTLDQARDQMAVLVSFIMGDEDLLKVFLQYIRITNSSKGSQAAILLLGPEVANLLDATRVVRPEVRHGALAAVYAAMVAAMHSDEGRLLASQLAEARQLGQHVQASLLPHIEQLLLVDFPLRSASALDKVDVGNGFKLDEVSVSLKVEVLARAHALLLQTGLLTWTQLEQYAMKPFHSQTFWKHANSLYRHFTVFFLSHALQAFPDMAAYTAVAVQILRIWFRSMIDDGRRNALKHMTLVLASNQHTCSLFRHVTDSQEDLLSDQSGQVRGHIMLSMLTEAASNPQWRSHVGDFLHDADDVLAARGRETTGMPLQHFRWQSSTANIVAAVFQAASQLLMAQRTGPQGATLLSVLLKRLTGWMAEAAVYLPRCHVAKQQGNDASAACLEGFDVRQDLSSLAQARQALQGSPVAHIGIVLATISRACGNQSTPQQFSQALFSQPALLRPLHTVITTCLEVPTAAETASSVDVALYEALADALAPSTQDTNCEAAGSGAVDTAAGLHILQQHMSLTVLGTFVPRYLERACYGHTVHQQPAVNCIRFLGKLFTQPVLRGSQERLKALLAPLLRPILRALCVQAGQQLPSAATKHALYQFLQELLTDNPFLVPEVQIDQLSRAQDADMPHVSITDRFQSAMQVFLTALCGDVATCIWTATCRPMPAAGSTLPISPLLTQECATACSSLAGTLGAPLSWSSLDSLYAACAPTTAAASTAGTFRPGGLAWAVAESALAFLKALGSSGTDGLHWVAASMPALQLAMLASLDHSKPLRPAYEALLALLQSAGMVTAEYQLPEHAAPARLLQSVQAMRLPHGPQTGTRQHISTQQQQANMQSHLTEGVSPQHHNAHVHTTAQQLNSPAQAHATSNSSAVQQPPRQQVFAHDVAFEAMAGLKSGTLIGATGWVKRRPVTKQLKNGEAVLLVDLEDENSARLRLICSGPAKDRAVAIAYDHNWEASSQNVLVLTFTQVAISKQTGLLQTTQASQLTANAQTATAARIRKHALQALAEAQADSQAPTQAPPDTEPAVSAGRSMQVDQQSQQQKTGTQQSVAMSSQRTAQYHWDAMPNASSQLHPSALSQPASSQHGLTPHVRPEAKAAVMQPQGSHQLPNTQHNTLPSPPLGSQMQSQTQGVASEALTGKAKGSSAPHHKTGTLSVTTAAVPSSNSKVTKTDVASMLNRLCEISHADKATAMSALRSAMEGRSDGIGAAMNRAAELLLPSKSSQAHH